MRLLLTTALVLITAAPVLAQPAPARYEAALAREKQVRASRPSAAALRSVVAEYEGIVRRYPGSGYSDNALWQAAGMAWFAYERHGQAADRRAAIRLLQQLQKEYPAGSLARQVPARLAQITAQKPPAPAPAARVTPPPAQPASQVTPPATPPATPAPTPPATPPAAAPAPSALVSVTAITRSALPTGERLTIMMDGEPQYHEERITGPDRLFFDFRNTTAADAARPSLERLTGGVVRDVRIGSRPGQTTRLVIEIEPNTRHSVFALYNP